MTYSIVSSFLSSDGSFMDRIFNIVTFGTIIYIVASYQFKTNSWTDPGNTTFYMVMAIDFIISLVIAAYKDSGESDDTKSTDEVAEQIVDNQERSGVFNKFKSDEDKNECNEDVGEINNEKKNPTPVNEEVEENKTEEEQVIMSETTIPVFTESKSK